MPLPATIERREKDCCNELKISSILDIRSNEEKRVLIICSENIGV
jgi:hypothetical protein